MNGVHKIAKFRYFTKKCKLEISVSHASKLYKTHPYCKSLEFGGEFCLDNQK